MKRIISLIIITIFITSLCACGCDYDGPIIYTKTSIYFDTPCTITVYDYDNDDIDIYDTIDEGFVLLGKLEKVFDKNDKKSDVYKLNHSNGKFVKVDDNLLKVIKYAKSFSKNNNDSFNVCLGSVIDLWGIDTEHPRVPADKEIKNALKSVDFNSIKIKGKKVKLKNKDTCLDFGAIAKGFATDALKKFLVKERITSGIIDLGGNITTIGSKDGGNFKIGIQKPFGKKGQRSYIVECRNKSLSTAGIYERYFKQRGKLYPHIINPLTGYPISTDLYSVTVIGDKSITTDTLSTALIVSGLKDGIKKVNKLDDIDAIFIDKYQKVHLSNNLKITGNNITFKNNK